MEINDQQHEWNLIGTKYASEVNEMVAFAEKNGWENWKGKEPEDKRNHLAEDVLKELREANKNGTINEFREKFPPAHSPFIDYIDTNGQSVEQILFVDNQKIIFTTGAPYEKDRQIFLLNDKQLLKLENSIVAIGKSKQNNVFAIHNGKDIITTQGWEGDTIEKFGTDELIDLPITSLLPFNDGKKVLCVTSEGIFLLSKESTLKIHPIPDDPEDEDDDYSRIDMENATLSNNNQFIVVGEQYSKHRILASDGKEIGTIGPQSEYPHFCLFSKDDKQLITNTCHFYNGITIGVETSKLKGIRIKSWEKSNLFTTIDEEMRVYAGVSASEYYILGDAYGYIRAFSPEGKCVWRHFLGSTITGMALSNDEETLWVGTYAGILHKLQLGKGHRDTHAIGNGNHFEEWRLLLWKNEEKELWW